jgi:peptidoglycan/xylan/chitin deacetylase (PgdA/CDA1 family)
MSDTDLLVLCYHAVSDDWPAALSVTPDDFEFQIDLLASRGYRGATFSSAASGDVSGKVVAITFDDGYRSVSERARPILDLYGFPATVFIPTRLVGHVSRLSWPGIDKWLGGPHDHELEPMSTSEIHQLVASGWEIGSHTLTHPRLPLLGDEDLRDQLVTSRHECAEMTGTECTSIAYPYGAVDSRVLRESEIAGYSAGALLSTSLRTSSPFGCPRIGVYHDDGHSGFRLKVSPFVRHRLRRSRAWPAIARLRKRALTS